jgi:DNA-binding protein H-NS
MFHIMSMLHFILRSVFVESYSELKSEMDNLEAQMEQAKKRERAEALKKVKQLCKEFGFTAGMLQGVLAKGRNRTPKT